MFSCLFSVLFFTAGLAAGYSPSPDPIAVAAVGLKAQIEDDIQPGDDSMLVSMATTGCETKMVGTTRTWLINWQKAEVVSLTDNFIFIDAPPIKLAIVGTANIPEQATKLRALHLAMQGAVGRCSAVS